MPLRFPLALLLAFVSLVAVRPPTALADQVSPDGPLYDCAKVKSDVVVSFRPGVSLKDLISWAMSFSCKNFVYSSPLASRSATIDIVAPNRLSAKQAWSLFHVSLRSMGLSAIPKGQFLEIVESARGPDHALPLRRTGSGEEQVERLIVQPEHVSMTDAKEALGALLSKNGSVVALESAGILLVTDYGSHTARMAELLKQVDRPRAHEGLYAIRLRYALVDDMADKLRTLLESESSEAPSRKGKKNPLVSTATPSLIIADERTSTLLLRCNLATYRRARAIVEDLDLKLEGDETGHVHIYPLDNADAIKLAATLSSLLQQRTTVPTKGPAPRVSGNAARVQGDVKVTADAETNSLLVLASLRDFVAMRTLIEELDATRPQVFLEATILEVDIDDRRNSGASLHFGEAGDNMLIFGGMQNEGTRTGSGPELQKNILQDGIIAGVIGSLLPTEKFLGVSVPSFAVLFQAAAQERYIDILSSPQLMTTNNTEAVLSVGQSVPYKAGVSVSPTGMTDNIQREDVDMTLKVTPHVNRRGMVRLEIDLAIKELLPNQEGLHPSWTTRKVVNTVVVKDQESVVIGGLSSTKESVTHSKVPVLSDLPLLGRLFRSSRREKSKKSLLILLTPYVLGSASEARRLTQRKLHERQEFLSAYRRLGHSKFKPNIDYSKKRGLLAEISKELEQRDREAAVLEELKMEAVGPISGPLEGAEDAQRNSF